MQRTTLKSIWHALLLCSALIPGFVQANEALFKVGFRFIQLPDPVSNKSMKAVIFYPANAKSSQAKIGPVELMAEENASLHKGRYPLILISHGNGGSLFSHHDTATFLAKNGFVAAAIEHPGDNFRDDSGLGTDRVLIGRNLQLSALVDHLLGHTDFSATIDPNRIGVTGFSAGGYTALLMVGAKPKFELLKLYCQRQPKSALCLGGGLIQLSSPPLASKADPRIRAAFVMSPVGAFFDGEGLSHINVPVYVYAASADDVLPVQENAAKVTTGIRTLTKYAEIPDAGHFVFLAPCSSEMKAIAPVPCSDRAGVNRRGAHETLNREIVTFFQAQMDSNSSLQRNTASDAR